MHTPDNRPTREEIRSIWNANAEWWDDRIGEGNQFQLELIEPTTVSLLELAPGMSVLDVACGAGRFARHMAELGGRVTAFDLSERFIERARSRTPADLPIEYHVADATRTESIAGITDGAKFDRVVCTMAIMDMMEIDPLFAAAGGALKPGGHFIFSLLHPCFASPGPVFVAERRDTGTGTEVRRGVRIDRYLEPFSYRGEGIRGQPESQYYFHRSFEEILEAGFSHGLSVTGFREPRLLTNHPGGNGLRWDDMPDIPPIVVIRMSISGPEK